MFCRPTMLLLSVEIFMFCRSFDDTSVVTKPSDFDSTGVGRAFREKQNGVIILA